MMHGQDHPAKIYGHQAFFEDFLKSLQKNNLHHAWLLSGPRGIGKSLVAQRLGRFLLRHPVPPYPATLPLESKDAVFDQVHHATHPDYLFIEKGEHTASKSKTFITIDAIRQITHFIQQTSQSQGWKVIIIDSIDDMNEKAQNALLKNLEEPKQGTLFFLISHSAHILPTIRSRCQTVKLSPLTQDEMAHFIQDHPLPLTPEEQILAQTLASGRVGVLQTILDEDGLGLFERLLEGVQEVLDLKAPPYPTSFHISESTLKRGEHSYGLLCYFLTWYAHRVTHCIATKDFNHPLTPKERRLFQDLKRLSLEKWLTVQEKILELLARENQLKVEPKQTLLECFSAIERAL